MKIIFLVTLQIFIFVGLFFAQDIFPSKNINDLQTETNYFNGKVVHLNPSNKFRYKTYGKKYIQITYIYEAKSVSIRLYGYFCILDKKITPAASIRFKF